MNERNAQNTVHCGENRNADVRQSGHNTLMRLLPQTAEK
jgi:hypothetical protein